MSRLAHIKKLLKLKWKYAQAKLVSTLVDYGLYLWFVDGMGMEPAVGAASAYGIAILVSYAVERLFVFDLQRKGRDAFLGSLMVSLVGLLLNVGLVALLDQIAFLSERQYLLKIIAVGLLFFYNFYFKRFVFEKRFFSVD